jgi:CRP/FNR family transcriptional activator FtrB
VRLPHSKHLLASLLGMTPENLSRTLVALAAHGVTVQGATVRIADRQRLREAVGWLGAGGASES